MTSTRRDFVKLALTAGMAVGFSNRVRPSVLLPGGLDYYPRAGDPTLKTLAATALDAAKGAGASYADVRFTLTRREGVSMGGPGGDDEHGAVGVRVLTDSAWGFAASPLWTTDEVARLAREAVVIAKANARGQRRNVDIGPPPPVASGTWRTPIQRDPFTVSIPEKMEVMQAWGEVPNRMPINATPGMSVGVYGCGVSHRRQEKTFASSDGAFVTQTLYTSSPGFSVFASSHVFIVRGSDLLQPRAGGWEVMAEAPLLEETPKLVEEALMMARDGSEPIQPDRYDILMNGLMVSSILAKSIGIAAELDRVLGYEANAGGTSYLTPPMDLLGTYTLGPSVLNVRGDRSRPDGLASVGWDDEGVVPDSYPIITDGVLMDYHTSRELVPTLAPWYAKTRQPAKSHGCASAENAVKVPLVQPPNLEMAPDPAGASFDDMIAGIEKGLVIKGGGATFDRQQLNGELGGGIVYEVRKGKRTRFLRDSECLVRAPELWKSILAVGNASTQRWTGAGGNKGQPGQAQQFSVGAPAVLFKNVAVTDRYRKA